jgi:hypothetical protein
MGLLTEGHYRVRCTAFPEPKSDASDTVISRRGLVVSSRVSYPHWGICMESASQVGRTARRHSTRGSIVTSIPSHSAPLPLFSKTLGHRGMGYRGIGLSFPRFASRRVRVFRARPA